METSGVNSVHIPISFLSESEILNPLEYTTLQGFRNADLEIKEVGKHTELTAMVSLLFGHSKIL